MMTNRYYSEIYLWVKNFFQLLLILLINTFSYCVYAQDCDLPQSLGGPDKVACFGERVILGYPMTCDNYNYKWLPESVFPSIEQTLLPNPFTIKIKENKTVTLQLNDNNGNLVAMIPVEISIVLDIDLGERREICPDESETLTASVSNGSGQYTYSWNTGETTQTIIASPEYSKYYSVAVEDIVTGCTREERVLVDVLRVPDISIAATATSICVTEDPDFESNKTTGENRNSLSECEDNSSHLWGGTGLYGYSYTWSTGETTPWIEATVPGIYSLTVTEDEGCSSVTKYEVMNCISSLEIKGIYGPNNSSLLDVGSGYLKYHWHDGSSNQTIKIVGPGSYSVTVTNDAGCTASDILYLKEYQY